jgi:speckle-type POZ protein
MVRVPSSDLSGNLAKLLEGKKGADVTFRVGDDPFPAHKIVLDSEDRKEMVKHLLVAADRCAVERLKLICEGIAGALRLITWIPR